MGLLNRFGRRLEIPLREAYGAFKGGAIFGVILAMFVTVTTSLWVQGSTQPATVSADWFVNKVIVVAMITGACSLFFALTTLTLDYLGELIEG